MDESVFIGLTMTKVEQDKYSITFHEQSGRKFRFDHEQDCCESVLVEDVIGNLDNLVGSPITMSEEVSSENEPAPDDVESHTWTFYKFATVKGYVTVRWLGQSNGCYSECVDFYEVGA